MSKIFLDVQCSSLLFAAGSAVGRAVCDVLRAVGVGARVSAIGVGARVSAVGVDFGQVRVIAFRWV